MPFLHRSLSAWGRSDFIQVLQDELLQQDALMGPMQRGLARGSYALPDQLRLVLLRGDEDAGQIRLKTGVCYTSIIPGCACENDPTPMSELPEYVEVRIAINRADGAATIDLLPD